MKGGRVFIPNDIIFEILQRLPAKSILRFRAVCRSWSSLISDPDFLLSHARRAKPSLLLARDTASSLHLRPIFCTNSCNDDGEKARTTSIEVGHPGLYLLASCDGLLCFQEGTFLFKRYRTTGYYYICNPLTDEWITTPKPRITFDFLCSYEFLCAFYYHPSMKEYRLLRSCRNGYEILTVGAKEWRRISSLFDDSTPSSILDFFAFHGGSALRKPPIALHGKLHYLPITGSLRIWFIMVFDVESEKFGAVSLPESFRTKECWIREAHLIEVEGKLGVSTLASDAMLDVWVLEDYEKEVWVKRYRVQIAPLEEESMTWFEPLVFGDDGEALVNWRGDLVLYDFKHHKRSDVIMKDDFLMTDVLYKESLIRHEFFDTGYQAGLITNLNFQQ